MPATSGRGPWRRAAPSSAHISSSSATAAAPRVNSGRCAGERPVPAAPSAAGDAGRRGGRSRGRAPRRVGSVERRDRRGGNDDRVGPADDAVRRGPVTAHHDHALGGRGVPTILAASACSALRRAQPAHGPADAERHPVEIARPTIRSAAAPGFQRRPPFRTPRSSRHSTTADGVGPPRSERHHDDDHRRDPGHHTPPSRSATPRRPGEVVPRRVSRVNGDGASQATNAPYSSR